MDEALEVVRPSRTMQAGGLLKTPTQRSMIVPMERAGEDSKWITLLALRVLKRRFNG
jgi:hypothetical protein